MEQKISQVSHLNISMAFQTFHTMEVELLILREANRQYENNVQELKRKVGELQARVEAAESRAQELEDRANEKPSEGSD